MTCLAGESWRGAEEDRRGLVAGLPPRREHARDESCRSALNFTDLARSPVRLFLGLMCEIGRPGPATRSGLRPTAACWVGWLHAGRR